MKYVNARLKLTGVRRLTWTYWPNYKYMCCCIVLLLAEDVFVQYQKNIINCFVLISEPDVTVSCLMLFIAFWLLLLLCDCFYLFFLLAVMDNSQQLFTSIDSFKLINNENSRLFARLATVQQSTNETINDLQNHLSTYADKKVVKEKIQSVTLLFNRKILMIMSFI